VLIGIIILECSDTGSPGGPDYVMEDSTGQLIGTVRFDLRSTRFGPRTCLLLGYSKLPALLSQENQKSLHYPVAILLEATS
jgi:hypothetical protein